MATEIAIFKLKDGRALEDSTSGARQILKDILNILTEQKDFQRAYWGTEKENSGNFRLFVDWDSVDAHIDFTKSESYKPFLDRFGEITDINSAQMFHVHFTPHPSIEALSEHVSPTTEINVLYFSSDFKDHDGFLEAYKQVIAGAEKTAKAQNASAGGWTEEQIPIPGTSEKGKAYVGLIGWNSMEAHQEWELSGDRDKALEKYKDQIKHESVTHFSGTQVTVELYNEHAAKTCKNFSTLAQRCYYNNVIFHRTIPHFMTQGGDPTGIGRGEFSIYGEKSEDEIKPTLMHTGARILSMVNSGPNTNGTQFFITLAPTPWLDGKHTIFRRVKSGMKLVQRMGLVETNSEDRPLYEIKIVKASIVEKEND